MPSDERNSFFEMPPEIFKQKADSFRLNVCFSVYEDHRFFRFFGKALSVHLGITFALSVALVLWVPACIYCMNGVAPPPARINWNVIQEHRVIPWLKLTPGFWFMLSSGLAQGIILCLEYYKMVISRGKGWAIKDPIFALSRPVFTIVFVLAGLYNFYTIGHPRIYSNTRKGLIFLPTMITGASFFLSIALLSAGAALLKLGLKRKEGGQV